MTYDEPSCAQDAFDDSEREQRLIAQGLCPKCKDELEHHRHRFSSERGSNLPDADWDECPSCGWKSDPE